MGFRFLREHPKGILKRAVSVLAGHKVKNIREAIEVLQNSAGKTINITVKTGKKGFTNARIVDVVHPQHTTTPVRSYAPTLLFFRNDDLKLRSTFGVDPN